MSARRRGASNGKMSGGRGVSPTAPPPPPPPRPSPPLRRPSLASSRPSRHRLATNCLTGDREEQVSLRALSASLCLPRRPCRDLHPEERAGALRPGRAGGCTGGIEVGATKGRASYLGVLAQDPGGQSGTAHAGSRGSSRGGARSAGEVANASHNSKALASQQSPATPAVPTRGPWPGAAGRPWALRVGTGGWGPETHTAQRSCRVKRNQTSRAGETGMQPRRASLPRIRALCLAPNVPQCPLRAAGSFVNRDSVPSPLGHREGRRGSGEASSS